MNMNESISKDGQGEEEQNNFSFGGKPGSYDSNSDSAQRKKSFSTTKPTEYNLPKEQPESTSKNLETKAKNILLPWRKKHNKDSETPHEDTEADANRRAKVTSDVNPVSTDTKSSSGPNATITTHGYSYVKTTTPDATSEQSKVKTSPPTSHEHSNIKASPTTHRHSKGDAGHPSIATTHDHSTSKAATSPVTHTHGHSSATTSPVTHTHGHASVKTTSPTNTHEHSKANTGPSATATTHGHINVKTTHPVSHGHSGSSTGPKSTAAAQDHSSTKTNPSVTHGHTSVKDNSSATKGYSNTDSNSDRDVIPGSFRGMTGTDVNPVDPSVYTSTGPKSNVSSGMNAVDPSVYTDTSSKSADRRKFSGNTATGPPQDTIKEIAQNVKMDENEQTGLKNDQVSGSDAIQQQTMEPEPKAAVGTSGFVSQQPSYHDSNKNIQHPEKNKVDNKNISERAAEKFNIERDDILESADDYQQKNIKSKTDSNWGPIEYSSSAGKNKNLQDVVIPSSMKEKFDSGTSGSQNMPKAGTELGHMKYNDNGRDNLQYVAGSQAGSQNTNNNIDMSPRHEAEWSGLSNDATTRNNVVSPAMKDEDMNEDSTKSHQYGLDYLDDVEDYHENDIDDYSNAKKNDLYSKKAYQGKPSDYNYEQREKIPGTFEPDTLSKSVQKQDEDPLSPRQTTNRAGMETTRDESFGNYEYSNTSGNKTLSDLSKNKSGPTPTRSNFIDQIEPRRAKTTQDIASDAKDFTNNPETGTTGNVDTTGRMGAKSKTFSSNPFDDSKNTDTHLENANVAAFDNSRSGDTTYSKSGDAETAAYDNIKNADPTYAKSQDITGMTQTHDQEPSSEQKASYGSVGNSQTQEYSSDDNIDVNKNAKVLEEDAPGYKREVDLKNKRRTDLGGADASNAYAAEVGNFPSLIDPHVPTYGFKDTNTSSSQKPSEGTYPETTSYSIHNETTSQGRKVSVGSMGSGKSKHHHNHHRHSRQNSSKGSDYDYNNSTHSTEHTPRHHRYGSDEGEQDYHDDEQGEEQAGKQSFMGRVRKSISGGTFGFRSEI
ncbi:AKH_1a_G0006790.mRNA.1.CDS.1 [Saccharomyces cerevisiae]|nr:AKH_1a_G0006790.mRNA.1.CDS.1 [Saccharomyces cerevisiae]CAI6530395.1 AKH_1a_G0006790.mRNA.1.CDS.1 [Saccharomyces cerevisiae]